MHKEFGEKIPTDKPLIRRTAACIKATDTEVTAVKSFDNSAIYSTAGAWQDVSSGGNRLEKRAFSRPSYSYSGDSSVTSPPRTAGGKGNCWKSFSLLRLRTQEWMTWTAWIMRSAWMTRSEWMTRPEWMAKPGWMRYWGGRHRQPVYIMSLLFLVTYSSSSLVQLSVYPLFCLAHSPSPLLCALGVSRPSNLRPRIFLFTLTLTAPL
jgi:hypothetical protein